MDRGRLFLKSSSRPRKQRRSSTPKRCPQPKALKSHLNAKTSPVLPVLTISSECWDFDISKPDEVNSICPFSYTELPVKGDGVSSILCVTLSENTLPQVDTRISRAGSKLKQARESLTQSVHPTKALFIKYTYDLLNQNSKPANFEGFTGSTEIKDCFGICLPNNTQEVRERKYELDEHLPPRLSGPRSVRTNQEFIRMSIAETNMIKAHKILHPLKQRQYLPRREDTYIPNRASALKECTHVDDDVMDMEL
ncbi:hypothetical protein K493DRAFT_312059 [Basidiobolus meristosporus CBS 931.73]|uniref:Uncharacterized protein n=1 Tax=Basidiobolus meristosporus CBS 931.73 TaxID=1314790 RepID=A0A1Y1YXV4_9FUNG|nr:hypothetical protein K493DRAFT_312059 [Basidiobolus meristosporus CBS 931.73]|eukprot:ORY02395.1 hypothetical protein K493DRAFT_312059 [Basidiobolus meristosporus CBS 931.73]